MPFSSNDIISLPSARTHLSEIAEQAHAGAEKIFTKNGESYVAMIDARRLDYYHQLERQHIHLLLIDEAERGLDDVVHGQVNDARTVLKTMKRRRAR